MALLAYWRLAVAAVVLAILGFAGWKVYGWHQDSLRVAAVEAQAARDVAQARQAVEQMKAQYAASQAASRGFQDELTKIRSRPVDIRPVRLCRPSTPVPAAATPPGGSGAAVPAAGVVQRTDGPDTEVRAGPDIGPALRQLARDADEVSAQGRAIQSLSADPAKRPAVQHEPE